MMDIYIQEEGSSLFANRRKLGYVDDENRVFKCGTGMFGLDSEQVGYFRKSEVFDEIFVYEGNDISSHELAVIYPNGAMYTSNRYYSCQVERIGRVYESGNIYVGKDEDSEEYRCRMDGDDVIEKAAAFLLLIYYDL